MYHLYCMEALCTGTRASDQFPGPHENSNHAHVDGQTPRRSALVGMDETLKNVCVFCIWAFLKTLAKGMRQGGTVDLPETEHDPHLQKK